MAPPQMLQSLILEEPDSVLMVDWFDILDLYVMVLCKLSVVDVVRREQLRYHHPHEPGSEWVEAEGKKRPWPPLLGASNG